MIAPFLSFTAEEAFAVFSPNAAGSIFTETFHELPAVAGHEALLAKWETIRAVRAEAQKQIEAQREAGKVGSSLQAELDIWAHGERHALLATLGDELRFVTITSRATLHEAASPEVEKIEVAASGAAKCDRCWHYVADVGSNPEHPTLCGRCESNLFGAGEVRQVA